MKTQEGRIITENPLRILGVYSDTPKKEIVANLGKMRAFSKTGKALSFDSDFTSLLGPVNRTLETIEKANNDISLPKDKLQAGLFWFMQHTDNDKAAIELLKTGDTQKAMQIIQKKGNYSSTVNMAVLALILKKWDLALYSYAYLLESDYRRKALIKTFTDTEDYIPENDLVDYISSKLVQEFSNAHWIEQLQKDKIEIEGNMHPFKSRFVESKLLKRLTDKYVTQIKKEFDFVLVQASSASSSTRKDANANLRMAEFVEEKCKVLLKELRVALGKDNKIYINYADKIANQILENCIAYYNNDADNPQRARNVIKYTRYAYRAAESKATKERAKKNLDILEETIEKQLLEPIEEELNAIDKLVNDYRATRAKYNNTYQLSTVIDDAYILINSIKNKTGKDDEKYLSISSNFVHFAIQEVIKEINSIPKITTYLERSQYDSLVKWGKAIFNSLVLFDKDEECQSAFSGNYNILNDMAKKITEKPVSQKPKILQSSNNNTQTTSSTTSSSHSHKSSYYTYANYKKNNPKASANQVKNNENNSLAYIFAGLGLIGIVFLLVVSLSYNHRKNSEVIKAPESSYNTDYSKRKKESSNSDASSESDEIQTKASETPSIEKENTTNIIEAPETFTTINYSTGDRPYQSTYGKGKYDYDTDNSLLIKNGSSTDAVVFLERLNGRKVRHVFIRRGENFNMTNIPGGQYIIKVMQGTDWNPEKDNGAGNPKGGFMYSCSISKSESYDPFNYPDPSTGRYSQGEVTLYRVENGNMQTEAINENDLF